MHYRTIADVDDGFGACREHAHPRADSDSRIYAAIPGRTVIGPVFQVHIRQFLGAQSQQGKNKEDNAQFEERGTLRVVRNFFQDSVFLLFQILIVYCICGTRLIPTEYTKRLAKETFNTLSIPYFIKKGIAPWCSLCENWSASIAKGRIVWGTL